MLETGRRLLDTVNLSGEKRGKVAPVTPLPSRPELPWERESQCASLIQTFAEGHWECYFAKLLTLFLAEPLRKIE